MTGKSTNQTEEFEVDAVHRHIVSRERVEPEEEFEKIPQWVWVLSILLFFVMGFYLGKFGGSWSTIAHEVEEPMISSGIAIKKEVKGDQVFAGVCQTCHQANGLGVAGQYPPLAGSEWLLNDSETPIRIVLYGLEGPITVKGIIYDKKMTPFYDKLSDEEIAAVLTHERSSWRYAAQAIKLEEVTTIRTKLGARNPWSSTELLALRLGK